MPKEPAFPPEFFTNDPFFSEFVYYHMKRASAEQKARLEPYELRFFANDRAMRRFADNETMERRILLLTRLGLSWSMTFYTDEADFESMYRPMSKYDSFAKKGEDIIKMLKAGDLFVFGSKEIMLYQALATNHCHGQRYVLDYDYLRMKQPVVGLMNSPGANTSVNMRDAEQAYHEVATLIASAQVAADGAGAIVGIEPVPMRFLIMLFTYRNRFVSGATLATRMGIKRPHSYSGRYMRNLFEMGMAQQIQVMDGPKKNYSLDDHRQGRRQGDGFP